MPRERERERSSDDGGRQQSDGGREKGGMVGRGRCSEEEAFRGKAVLGSGMRPGRQGARQGARSDDGGLQGGQDAMKPPNARTHARTHIRTRARAHTHTHTQTHTHIHIRGGIRADVKHEIPTFTPSAHTHSCVRESTECSEAISFERLDKRYFSYFSESPTWGTTRVISTTCHLAYGRGGRRNRRSIPICA